MKPVYIGLIVAVLYLVGYELFAVWTRRYPTITHMVHRVSGVRCRVCGTRQPWWMAAIPLGFGLLVGHFFL